MAFFDFFKRKSGSSSSASTLHTTWTTEGVDIALVRPLREQTAEALLDELDGSNSQEVLLGAYLAQLIEDHQCTLVGNKAVIPWQSVFDLLGSAEHDGAVSLIGLPPSSVLRPVLDCFGTFSAPDFELEVAGWTDGVRQIRIERQQGAVVTVDGQEQLLGAPAWGTCYAIQKFGLRPPSLRSQHENELAWGRIRKLADAAHAMYASPYLESTHVLTPDSLRMLLNKEDTSFGKVTTVMPTFEGAPDGWLAAFDGFNSVQSHYDLTRGAGRVRIVLSEPVRKVLEVIKREMPGRKVAGLKAEKFVHNPFAFLGDAAHEVLIAEQFEEDRASAGSIATVFGLVARSEVGRLTQVDLVVTEHYGDGSARTDTKSFVAPAELDRFLAALRCGLEEEREYFAWDEHDLSLDADSSVQLERGLQLSHLWRHQPDERISFTEIYELDGYSGRIEGIGVARPIYVPVFQSDKKDSEQGDEWLPGDVEPSVAVTIPPDGATVLIPLSRQWVDDFENDVLKAERIGSPEIRNDELPTPLTTEHARVLVDSFKAMLRAQDHVKADAPGQSKERKPKAEVLLVKTNFHGVDYLEAVRASLNLPEGTAPKLPTCLRPEVKLKAHQQHGVAWFQHLVSCSPVECRGALLADDMGLGKTLQLLTVLARYHEDNPEAAPSIILAPKSLLENWSNETKKFFTPAFPEVLVLFGDELKARKQPLALIDEALQAKGIVELLKPRWAGGAKLIVTSYEVLTSYEFSFARQPFSFVICDEAQRIKTPGTLVTLAAKKLKADFRIACTGTPVENSLADLWCLFDFVQPGLLGSLEAFGKTYRRPIECKTDEQRQALGNLQKLIAPQTLRRTKADIAADLPAKYFALKLRASERIEFKPQLADDERLEIMLSEHQRVLYKGGLKKLQDAAAESDAKKRSRLSFGALHLMKAVCAEPYCLPGSKFLLDACGIEKHLTNSPKMNWLLQQLRLVQEAGEKAIVFTELRETQLALYYFLKVTFGLQPIIINGDSSGRQAQIDRFSSKQGFDVIILSTLAAGAGLNVTAANHVFHFTRAWNPSKEAQATDRAFRIGQERDVYVYCPTMVADDFTTFEIKLDKLLKRKAGLAGSTLDDGGLTAMLNGGGLEVSYGEIFGPDTGGMDVPRRNLNLDDVDRMDGDTFEVFCALLWSKQAFSTTVTPKRGGDGGVDVLALCGSEGLLMQCKSSKSAALGWDAVKEVAAGAARYQAQFAGTRFRRVAVTNQRFNGAAVSQAEANRVVLVDRGELERLLASYPVSNHELDSALMGGARSFSPTEEGTPEDRAAAAQVAQLYEALGDTSARRLVRTILEDREICAVGVPVDFDFERDDLTKLIRPMDVPWRRLRLIAPFEGGWQASYDEGVYLAFRNHTLHCWHDPQAPHGWRIQAVGCVIG